MSFYHVDDVPDVPPEQVLLEEVRRSRTIVLWLQMMVESWRMAPEDPDEEWQRLQAESEGSGEESAPLEAMAKSRSTGLPPLGTVVRFEKGGTVAPTEYAAWLDRYERERIHAARVAKMAIDAGVAERLVQLEEQKVDTLLEAIRAYHREAGIEMTPERARILGRQLRGIGGAVAS